MEECSDGGNFVEAECNWLEAVIEGGGKDGIPEPPAAHLASGEWARFVRQHGLNGPERLFIGIGLSQYIAPDLLRKLLDKENSFRLMQCAKTGQLLPTGETFLHLVAGTLARARIAALRYLGTDHLFYQKGLYSFGETSEGLAAHYGVIRMAPNYRDLFLHDRHSRPRFSTEFPAHLLESGMDWEDMVLTDHVARRLEDVRAYLTHEDTLRNDWGMDRQLRRGYRCLFHGPSGTGKTLAATLLGKLLRRDVYRVDLSTIVSKYIGETSKNLNALFNTAEDKNWILFFDEGMPCLENG